uniref:MFS transporter n=1 Tax=Streptomyces corallincola TaxID=2851888 RepID=UPI0027E2EB2A|nr:MFS transporter [Streptomyces corallincola]
MNQDNSSCSAWVFALVWGSQLVSLLGSGAAAIALSLSVYSSTGRASDLALIASIGTLSSIYLSPFAGTIADHFSRRTVIIVSNAILGLLAAALGLTARDGVGSHLPLVVILVFLSGVFSAALTVTLSASVRQIRSEADLTRINGITSLLENIPTLIGPLLGAAIYAVASPALVFMVDAGSFLVGAAVVSVVRWPEAVSNSVRSLRPFAGAKKGLLLILRNPSLRFLQFSFAASNFFVGLGTAVTTAYVASASSAGHASWNLAAVSVAGSAGLLLGSSLTIVTGGKIDRRHLIVASLATGALLGRVALVATIIPVIWIICYVTRSAFLQLTNAPLTAIWQERIPNEIQGTVFGARRLLGQGPFPLAVLLGGFLSDHLFQASGTLAKAAAHLDSRLAGPSGGPALLVAFAALGEVAVAVVLFATPHLKRLAQPSDSKESKLLLSVFP